MATETWLPEGIPTCHPVARLEFLILPKHLGGDRLALATLLHVVADELEKGEHLDTARLILSLPATTPTPWAPWPVTPAP